MPLALATTAGHRPVPWRNGAGTTVELASDPPGGLSAGMPFLWRLSLAEVGRDGPFSLFPGVDRTMMLAAGRGMALELEPPGGAPPRALSLDVPFAQASFPGDWPAACRLRDGPVRAFNLMVDRARASAALHVLRGRGRFLAAAPGGAVLVHVLAGRAAAAGAAIAAGETLVASGADAAGLALAGAGDGTVAAVVTLRLRTADPAA